MMFVSFLFAMCDLKRLFDCPSVPQTAANSSGVKSMNFCPFRKASRHSVDRKCSVVGSIADLLFRCCPSDVLWFVIFIHVDSVNRMPLTWASANVRKKACESILACPSLTHDDSAGLVVQEMQAG